LKPAEIEESLREGDRVFAAGFALSSREVQWVAAPNQLLLVQRPCGLVARKVGQGAPGTSA